jgi:hypothetical protein
MRSPSDRSKPRGKTEPSTEWKEKAKSASRGTGKTKAVTQ